MTASLPRVVFDTNILIRAFLSPDGPSGKCLELARKNEIMLCVSDDVFVELEDVIDRPYIHKALGIDFAEQKDYFLDQISIIAYFADAIEARFKFPRDPDDEFVIDLAVSSEADYLITCDRDLLDLMTGIDDSSKEFRQKFRRLKIVRPNEFLQIVSESRSLFLKP